MKAIGKTPVYWIVRIVLSLAIVFILSACAAPAPLPAEEGTPTPTLTPTLAPTATRESTPTSRPTEIVVSKFTSTLVGVSPEFARKLDAEGINESLNDDGTIKSVTVGYNPDGTAIVEKDVKIVDAGINFQTDFQGNILKDANGKPISQDIHNLGYVNGIATVVDGQGRVLHWNETGKEWVASLPISTDIEKPTFYPPGRQDLVIETVLLNPELNKPFDKEAVDNFAGWSIFFEYDKATDSSHAQLNPRDYRSVRFALNANGNPAFFTDGVNESTLIQLLNPADPKNVKAYETLFALATAGEWWSNTTLNPTLSGNYRALFYDWFIDKNSPNYREDIFGAEKQIPMLELAQKGGWFADHAWGTFPDRPNLDSLFSQPGNDISKLDNPLTPGFTLDYWLSEGYKLAKTSLERQAAIGMEDKSTFITADFQKILFPLSFARK
ncbi:MAG: hypothetical protein HYR70_07910 [Chloroflexi bacterium]|nr:hypothetical protein [Chloroflexota bacterium]MBI3341485.1 hypothetical protein [Chloroflexota bacterium]